LKKVTNLSVLFLTIFIVALMSVYIPNKIFAANKPVVVDNTKLSSSGLYNYKDYVIDSYDVNISVNENNTFNIQEKIVAYFNIEKHGIYRSIPLRNKITRLDGTSSTNNAKVSNIDIDSAFSTSYENNDKVLKIGDEKKFLTGTKEYNISYSYGIGNDTCKDYDELYFNIIGDRWDAPIGNITFTITMPKDFDVSKLGFSSGKSGSFDSSNIVYTTNGNTITGYYDGHLDEYQALTIRLELPEGYFAKTNSVNIFSILSIIFPILFTIITIRIWIKIGKDKKIIETIEFYPPIGTNGVPLNSAELGFVYKGKVTNNDIISLLVFLANKGYIEIEEIEETSLFNKHKSFRFNKLKDYDGNNENERIFLNGLFKDYPSLSFGDLKKMIFKGIVPQNNPNDSKNSVALEDLTNNFYHTLVAIAGNFNTKDNKSIIFEKGHLQKQLIIVTMIILTLIFITIVPMSQSSDISLLIIALLFPLIGTSLFCVSILGVIKTAKNSNMHKPAKIVLIIVILLWGSMFGFGFGVGVFVGMVLPTLLYSPIYLSGYAIGVVGIIIMLILLFLMPKRTTYGCEMAGKIGGFKTFLETAEKQKLEMLVMENPSYFYDILPYTYVLGISSKWIGQFSTIAIQSPNWYNSSSPFDMHSFGSFMDSTMDGAQSAMSSGSSGSGGGSSGGGSGGGGGGSW